MYNMFQGKVYALSVHLMNIKMRLIQHNVLESNALPESRYKLMPLVNSVRNITSEISRMIPFARLAGKGAQEDRKY